MQLKDTTHEGKLGFTDSAISTSKKWLTGSQELNLRCDNHKHISYNSFVSAFYSSSCATCFRLIV